MSCVQPSGEASGADASSRIAAAPSSPLATLSEIWRAIVEMPQAMRQMAWMSLFQWYGFSIYWSYAALSIGRSVYATTDKTSPAFRDAVLTAQTAAKSTSATSATA